jgi:hypothetical protein
LAINKPINKTAGIRLTRRGDRRNAFRIQRFNNDHGLQVYALENTAEQRKIFIPRFIFGRFRAQVSTIVDEELGNKVPTPFEFTVSFLNREYFYFKSATADIDNLIIQDIEEREGSSGYLTVSRRSLKALEQMLYSDKLQHPNDVLEEIISYHKLFQFSFVKGSKSITSDLSLRKDVLQSIERYTPSLAQKVLIDPQDAKQDKKADAGKRPGKSRGKRKAGENLYKPKLGERFNEKDIRVDYDEIFGGMRLSLAASPEADDGEAGRGRKKKPLSQFVIPLETAEIKAFDKQRFYFELSPSEASEFRERFINDRSAEFFLGFEIVDALFSFNRSIRTFRFPLYYMRVRIRESGRGVYLEALHDGRIFLNHLALAQLVDRFSDNVAGSDPVDRFFQTLLAQDVSVDRLNDRIRLSRYLPVKEAIFDRSREILFGYQDENGKGGILGDLQVQGIEVDLQSVFLYRAPKLQSAVDQALDLDLEQINRIAHTSSKRFYASLLGRFLTPEIRDGERPRQPFAPVLWMPGALPLSTRTLVDRLDRHDILLLEGPPGTGKTYTIMNLLLHCINSRQKVLVVSDQQAAIEALVEKLQEYLVGDQAGTPTERKWKELLFSAIKVVDRVQTGDQALPELVADLADTFKVQELEPGSAGQGENLDRKIGRLGEQIEKLKAQIEDKMLASLGEQTPFDRRVVRQGDGNVDIPSLVEFLGLAGSRKTRHREIVDAFVAHRCMLVESGMDECYPFFKIPAKNFRDEIQRLRDDARLLTGILQARPGTVDALQELTLDHPRHEIVRYLETRMQRWHAPNIGLLARLLRRFRNRFAPPLRDAAQGLLQAVQGQIELLKMADDWSEGLWRLLRELHEAIRIGEPHPALTLYRNYSRQSGIDVGVDPARGSSIQGDLEQIEDLFEQQDKVVRERLAENLRDIVRGATGARREAGTNSITSILALVDSLKQFTSLGESGEVFEELRQKLFETFPVWVVRKQVVPFLLPCEEQSFDLVIVDEATQCRVDDAMPLMFRAKKILVVGDDRQTVLQKESVIDDYLFRDHELDEHLRSTQARGFKGGGSHIFALVKAIKQASVLLDEHYRCPADIIEFSNRYVYDGELNVMQWRLPEHEAAVVVDYSENNVDASKKPTSGKFKGIETGMIDRFMDFVVSNLKAIEKTSGRRIHVDTDVALCYFLLKNEPYVKQVKEHYLRKLNRGDNLLDGAGAALQGKERDYVFYFWDITRYNLGAFKQGDDAEKRKGELNVLMSRPKKKAFHFLHRNFEQLEHGRSNISSYLWQAYHRQQQAGQRTEGNALDESLLGSLLNFTLSTSGNRGLKDVRRNVAESLLEFRENIVVGDAGRQVDLIAYANGDAREVVGVVDLSAFGCEAGVGRSVVDYYFQLKRVSPGIDPVFVMPHELIEENGQTFRALMQKLELLDVGRGKRSLKLKKA